MKKTTHDMDETCPDLPMNNINNNRVPYETGQMMNLSPSYIEDRESDDNVYFVKGKNMNQGQPCTFFNKQVSVNLPDRTSSTNSTLVQ